MKIALDIIKDPELYSCESISVTKDMTKWLIWKTKKK
jgi:hypothetical protein